MNMFNGFNQAPTAPLTPQVALVAALIYISAADGHLDDAEISNILRFAKTRANLDAALEYQRRSNYDQFLQAAGATLSPQQKMFTILNCADMAMGDGYLAPPEQARLNQMAQAFQIPEQHLGPYVQALMLKNNMSVFG